MEIPLQGDDTLKFLNIKTLHYDGNKVENRDHLNWISTTFPSLTSLVLCDCPLWSIRWGSSHTRKTEVVLLQM